MSLKVIDFASNYKSNWYKASDYQLDAGMLISPAKNASIEYYDPFSFYENDIPDEIVSGIFGDVFSTKFKLHTAFASLDYNNKEMLLNWVRAFGVPFSLYVRKGSRSPRYINFPIIVPKIFMEMHDLELQEHWIYIDHFANEVERFQKLMQLQTAINNDDVKYLKENYILNKNGETPLISHDFFNDNDYSEVLSAHIDQTERKDGRLNIYGVKDKHLNEWIGCALYNNENIINPAILGVSPVISYYEKIGNKPYYVKEPKWQWAFSSLLSLIYLMAFLDSQKGTSMVKCVNPKCGKFFVPSKITGTHCSLRCQRNHKQQRYRDSSKTEE